MKEKLSLAIEENGLSVEDGIHNDVTQIIQEYSTRVMSEYPEGLLPHVFWEQQLKAVSCKETSDTLASSCGKVVPLPKAQIQFSI